MERTDEVRPTEEHNHALHLYDQLGGFDLGDNLASVALHFSLFAAISSRKLHGLD